MNYIIKQGESIGDAVLNATGSINNLSAILEANDFTDWTPTLTVGQSIYIPGTVIIQPNNLRKLQSYPACNNSNNMTTISEAIILTGSPIILNNQTGSVSQLIPAGTLLTKIAFKKLYGTALTVKIGTTAGADDIMPELPITDYLDLTDPEINGANNYTESDMTLYFTISGGSVKIRIDAIFNYI